MMILAALTGVETFGARAAPCARLFAFACVTLLLWQATAGLAFATEQREQAAFAVMIESLSAGGRSYSPQQEIRLPAGTTQLQLVYQATGLDSSGNVEFRYRLDGVDANWVDAGAQREVVYTNLQPGAFRFEVDAVNSSGMSGVKATNLAFTIEPTVFQTLWFRACCAGAALLMLVAAYRLRMQHVADHLRALQHERMVERERIARDLHDTLLQGIHGQIQRFQAVALSMRQDDPSRAEIQATLMRANEVFAEGRDKVVGLRAASDTHGNLADAFEQLARDVARVPAPRFRVTTEGVERTHAPLIRDEIYRISAEAIVNAFRHASARNIEVEIGYGLSQMRLRIRDDGRGIPDEVLGDGERSGHWGLPGMHERAARIGARLSVWSKRGAGTQVELQIPGSMAYSDSARATLTRWLKRFRRGEPA
jgi:signal transduction histidine kinase